MDITNTFKEGQRLVFLSLAALGLLILSHQPGLAVTTQSMASDDNFHRWNLPTKTIAMGGAYAARGRGIEAGSGNPASLSRLQTNQFAVEFQRWGEDWDTLGGALAVPWLNGHSVMVDVNWLNYGELNPRSDTEFFRPQASEALGGLHYSFLVSNSFSVGLSAQAFTSKIGFRDRETKGFANAGLLWQIADQFWWGISARNIGGSLSYTNGEEKLPDEYRSGFELSLFKNRLVFSGDLVQLETPSSTTQDFHTGGAGGIALNFVDWFRVSGGYHSYYENDRGFTGGIEVIYPNFSLRFSGFDSTDESFGRFGAQLRF